MNLTRPSIQKLQSKSILTFALVVFCIVSGYGFSINNSLSFDRFLNPQFFKAKIDESFKNVLFFVENTNEQQNENEDDETSLDAAIANVFSTESHLLPPFYAVLQQPHTSCKLSLRKIYLLYHSLKLDC